MEYSADRKHLLETLALMPTWRCDVVCHHCVFSSAPSLEDRLGLNVVSSAIREVASVSTVKRVTISGGEPFLDFDYLMDVARATNAAGLLFRVVTNASFASDAPTAERLISALATIGLESICISWDQYHAQFIDPRRVSNTIRACRKNAVSVRLTVVVSRKSSLASALEVLGDEAFELPITQVKCLPVGRAEKKIPHKDLIPPAVTDTKRACRFDFDTLSLTPNGDVFPCCAVGGFTDGIRLGRYPEMSMQSLLERRDRDLVWVILAARGPHYFIDHMTPAEQAEFGLASDSLHDCVACHRLFRSATGVQFATRVVDRLKAEAASIWKTVDAHAK